jgi:cytochrome c-type biogenesis protein
MELLVTTFLAGIAALAQPCVAPLLPAYASLLLNTPEEGVPRMQLRPVVLALLGFVLFFVLLGAGASSLGQVFQGSRDAFRIVAALVLIGSAVLQLLRIYGVRIPAIPGIRVKKVTLPDTVGFLTGILLAITWLPCIGPQLGFALFAAGNRDSLGQGMLLLGIFALGLFLPLVLIALIISRFQIKPRVTHTVRMVALFIQVALGIIFLLDLTSILAIPYVWFVQLFGGRV